MRIPIREQLALLVLIAALVALAIISIATWVNNYNFVVVIISQSLTLTASLKAAQLTSSLELLQSTCGTITTRLLVQEALQQFYERNDTGANWVMPATDVQAGLDSLGYIALLQAIIYPRDAIGDIHGLLNVTKSPMEAVTLPYNYPNGTAVVLGDDGIGYPPMLYPNLTYVQTGGGTQVYAFPDFILNTTSSLFLGPLQVNNTFAIVSLTLPIINIASANDILGFMTVIADASGLSGVLNSREGISETATLLLLGPARADNLFTYNDRPLTSTSGSGVNITTLQSAQVDFVFNPETIPGQDNRHNAYNGSSFPLADYPAALYELSMPIPHPDNGTSQLSTTNEQGAKVAVGVARPQTTLVDWVLILELDHADAFAPTAQLRNILLACVFGTAGVIALLVIPVAHLSVLPIQRLKEATKVSVQTPGDTSVCVAGSERLNEPRDANGDIGNVHDSSQRQQSKQDKKFLARMRHLWHSGRSQSKSKADPVTGPRTFKLPGKVEEKKHFITDELTELTSTFNELSDELTRHYTKLEERVAARTQELETSKKAAEAANESKTLFIASISHELKTPLNGILGMCAVCMSEDSISSVKASLQVIYKSGDLLLHLLNDLLTFSKNQIGQSLALEESEFALSDIKSQIVSLFDKQVRESHVNFGFKFVGTDSTQPGLEMSSEGPSGKKLSASGPPGTGRLKDMRLWGDMHRILQVIINLVSNSLKFAAESGKVEVRIKCIGDPAILSENSSRKEDSRRLSTTRHSTSSASKISNESRAQTSSATTSRLRGTSAGLYDPGRSLTPPPANARTLVFEFEVEDNGPGIPPHLQQSIFEPFVQGDVGLTKKYGGTGLGLSICSQLASLLGGAITLKSIVGIGTTFNMRIPLKLVDTRASSQSSNISRPSHLSMHSGDNPHTRPSRSGTPVGFENDPKPRLVGLSLPFFAPTLPLQSEARSNQYEAVDRVEISTIKNTTGKLQVLVAEDNLVNQEVVLRMLKLENINDVTVAKDGQEAYNIVKASMDKGIHYDIIFMDVQMPNMDGLQSTRLIRQIGYSGPIVALTAFAEESNIKDCIDSGMNMFLSKPIRRPALKQVLERFATIPEG